MSPHRTLARQFALASLTLAFASSAQAQKDMAACKPVLDAHIKIYGVPSHEHVSQVSGPAGSKPEVLESIRIGNDLYVTVGGKWRHIQEKAQDAIAREQDNIKNAKAYSCHRVRDEAVNGTAATVYAVSIDNGASRDAGQIWVARSSGLLLKEEMDMGVDNKDGRHHVSAQFDYANVQAPPGAK